MFADASLSTEIDGLFSDPRANAQLVRLNAGEIIFDGVAPLHDVMYVKRGEVRVYQHSADGAVRFGAIAGPGDWIGAAAVAGMPFNGKATATVTSELLVMPVERFLQLLRGNPETAVAFLRLTAQRLVQAQDETNRLMFKDCNARLIDALLGLSNCPTAVRVGDDVTVRVTHQQLAQAVGAARETISLALTELRHQNLLKTGRSRLTFNPTLLSAFTGSISRRRPALATSA